MVPVHFFRFTLAVNFMRSELITVYVIDSLSVTADMSNQFWRRMIVESYYWRTGAIRGWDTGEHGVNAGGAVILA